ncbi:MAG: FMN-binding negative transcriptional regulator [Proteobacteria bacterium]|nr:FMN-binding negative transcriptional regulator [Pseudomonadota bacterium]
MYLPEHFREADPERLADFILRHPLGALVAQTPEGLTANHIPMLYRPAAGGHGVLCGHIARGNRLWKLAGPGTAVLAIFAGAAHYLTPSWYPAKKIDGKVVPTWNYAVVHAHGTIRFLEGTEAALSMVRQLTEQQEGPRAAPWAVSDAPPDYLESMLRSIVAFEIAVTRLEGKFKASQHRSAEERVAVRAALAAEGLDGEAAAEIVREPRPR